MPIPPNVNPYQYRPYQMDPNLLLQMYQQNGQSKAKQPSLAGGVKDIISGSAKDVLVDQFSNNFASSAVENALYNQGADIAAQEAWNQGANLASQSGVNALAGQAGGGILSNAAGMGAGPIGAIAAGTYLGGKAGLDMLKGKKPDLAGRVVLGIATGGLSEVANKIFGGKSTKQYQQERIDKLLKTDPTFAKEYANRDAIKATVLGDQARASAATPADFRGFWDDPNTPQQEKIWLNKTGNIKDYSTLGGSDVAGMPWFKENIKGFSDKSLDERIKIADRALASGTAFGNKGNIDFKVDPNSLLEESASAPQASNKFATSSTTPLPSTTTNGMIPYGSIQGAQMAAEQIGAGNRIPVRPVGYDWNGKAFIKRK
jgi:hypothetical protein